MLTRTLSIKSHTSSVLSKETIFFKLLQKVRTRISFQLPIKGQVSFLASSFQDHAQSLSLPMHLSRMLHHLVFPPGLVSTRIVRAVLLQSMNCGDVAL